MNTDIQPPQPQANAQPVTPAPAEQQAAGTAPEQAPPEPDKKTEEPAAKPKEADRIKPPKPKQPGHGVNMAIAATVIIVLGLAALATYAYLKTR